MVRDAVLRNRNAMTTYIGYQLGCFFLAAILLSLTLNVQAQQVVAHWQSDDIFELSLEQLLNIKVSARRVEESLMDVPSSLVVISKEEIHRYNIQTIYDLAYWVPNLSYHESFGFLQERPNIRGMTSINGEQPVGLFINGVSAQGAVGTLPFHDLERIEVLLGPQAALYGRSTFAGAINFITQTPKSSQQTDLSINTAQYGQQKMSLLTHLPLNENTQVGLSVSRELSDGFYENDLGTNGGQIGGQDRKSLAIDGQWSGSDFTSVHYRFYTQHVDDGILPVYMQGRLLNNCFLDTDTQYYCGAIQTPEKIGFNNIIGNDLYSKKRLNQHYLNIEHPFEKFNGRLIIGKMNYHDAYKVDGNYSEQDANIYYDFRNDYEQSSAEIIIDRNFGEATVLMGGSYFLRKTDSDDGSQYDVINSAIFSHAEYKIDAQQSTSLELRVSNDRIMYVEPDDAMDQTGRNQWRSVSGKVSYAYQMKNDWLFFTSLTQANKPGGFNSGLSTESFLNDDERSRVLRFLAFDEEQLLVQDMGIKGPYHGVMGSGYFQASAYFQHWSQLQLSQSLNYISSTSEEKTVSTVINAGGATGYGFELNIKHSYSPQWHSRFNASMGHTRFTSGGTTKQEALVGDASIKDNMIPNSPEYTASFAIEYMDKVLAKDISVLIDYHWEDKRYVAVHNFAYTSAIEKINASLRWYAEENWSISLWGKNLTDNTTPESVSRFVDPELLSDPTPRLVFRRSFAMNLPFRRTFGISLNAQFN